MIVVLFLIGYTLNIFFNRWLYFKMIEKDEDFYGNPFAILSCFMSLFGTIILTVILMIESDFFTPKHLRKK